MARYLINRLRNGGLDEINHYGAKVTVIDHMGGVGIIVDCKDAEVDAVFVYLSEEEALWLMANLGPVLVAAVRDRERVKVLSTSSPSESCPCPL